MVNSMTGFANGQGNAENFSWTWELRSVNARGLDLRLRVPDWLPGFEQKLRSALSDRLARGSVTLNLRLSRDEGNGDARLDQTALSNLVETLAEAESQATKAGLSLAPVTAADLISWRGVMDAAPEAADPELLAKAILADFPLVLDSFLEMRSNEGRALAEIITGQLDQIETLTETAAKQAIARQPAQAQALRDALARVLDNTDGVNDARLTQELALLAVKSDVTEEIDRLKTHVLAARDLLAQQGPRGRKFDFLMQEFNREANTLCSKSQDKTLTATGLDLKALIDQMREQIQNVE